MKIRYTLIALLFFAFFCTRLHASYDCRISSVSIDGLKNVNLKNVLSVVNLKNGKYYSKNDAKDDAISIINLGYFSDIKIYFNEKTGNLTFKVTEKPLVERINFVGNLKFSTFKLKSISKLKRKKYYDFLDFEATKKKIEALYIKNGYSNCKVELSSSIDKNTNKITVTFFITENNKIFVAGININGCNYFNEKKILKIMKTKLNSTFKEDIYQVDLKSIESLYKNNGFVDYRFISLVSKCNDTAMFLTFNIYEGNRYKIRSVICNGNFAIDKKKMNELIKIKENEIFNKYKIKEIENDIKKKYYDKGYLNVIVKSYFNKIDVKNNFLDVFFLIDEGKIFYFGNLYINGLVHTKDKVLRREMLLRPGDVFSPEKYLKSINMIYNLGFIKNVDHNMLQNEISNVVDLNFNVVEENIDDLRKIGTAIGFEYPYNPLFSIKFSKINMFGLGQTLNLFYEISKKQKKYDINWIYPWVFDKNIDFILDFYKRDNKIIFKNKKKGILEDIKKNGFEAKLSPRINKKIVFPFGYRYENVYFCSKSVDNDAILKIENNKISSVFSHFLYDSTDCILDPSSGNLESITFQIANKIFGGDTNFVKCIVNSKLFFPILHKFVLSINFRFGLIAEYFNQQVPTSELFFIGGADTVRGYEIDETEHYDGGKFMGIINMECKFPIITKCKKTIVQGFLFYDIGTLGKDDNAIYQGFGIGIGIPANVFGINFPIRFDLSQGLRDEFKPKFYFSLINRI